MTEAAELHNALGLELNCPFDNDCPCFNAGRETGHSDKP
jgi:hypothetical protein